MYPVMMFLAKCPVCIYCLCQSDCMCTLYFLMPFSMIHMYTVYTMSKIYPLAQLHLYKHDKCEQQIKEEKRCIGTFSDLITQMACMADVHTV